MEQPENKPTPFIPEPVDSPLATVGVRRRRIGAWIVTHLELESLRSASLMNSVYFGLFGIAFGAAVSLIITIKSAVFNDAFTYAVFWAAFLLMVFLTLLFAALTIIGFKKASNLVEQIKTESGKREDEILDRII